MEGQTINKNYLKNYFSEKKLVFYKQGEDQHLLAGKIKTQKIPFPFRSLLER